MNLEIEKDTPVPGDEFYVVKHTDSYNPLDLVICYHKIYTDRECAYQAHYIVYSENI